jgi:hypothetical protein
MTVPRLSFTRIVRQILLDVDLLTFFAERRRLPEVLAAIASTRARSGDHPALDFLEQHIGADPLAKGN